MRIVTIFSLFFSLSAFADQPIPNFSEVEPGVYRGGLPGPIGYPRLKELGVKTVINLVDLKSKNEQEERFAEKAGIRVINIPMHGLKAPSDDEVDDAIAALSNPANRPIFIHCQHGKDRTGLVVALYRVEKEHISPEKAFGEMMENGFSKAQVLMKNYFEYRVNWQENE